MSKTQRNVTIGLWGLMVLSLLGLVAMMRWQSQVEAAWRQEAEASTQPTNLQALSIDAPSFKLTDQQGKPFDSADLKGKIWTASFFFSRCEGVCPGMLTRVKDLQKAVPNPDVHNVYLTADPERDTVERLAEYSTEANADPNRWHMLTGDVAEMKRIATAFGKPYTEPAGHSAAIILMDRESKIVGVYESRHIDEMKRLAGDLERLLAEPVAQAGAAQ